MFHNFKFMSGEKSDHKPFTSPKSPLLNLLDEFKKLQIAPPMTYVPVPTTTYQINNLYFQAPFIYSSQASTLTDTSSFQSTASTHQALPAFDRFLQLSTPSLSYDHTICTFFN